LIIEFLVEILVDYLVNLEVSSISFLICLPIGPLHQSVLKKLIEKTVIIEKSMMNEKIMMSVRIELMTTE